MKSRSPRLLIFLTIFIDLLGFGIVIPIQTPIAKHYIQAEHWPFLISLLSASFSFFQMLCAPFWGRLSDRVGRRPILLLSLFGSVVSYATFAFAQSYSVLLLARSFGGICGANISAAQAYIADITPPEKRTAGMGLVGMAFGLGFTFGPIIGGLAAWAAGHWSPGSAPQLLPGLVAASICLINLLWAFTSLPESLPPELRGKAEASAPVRFAPLTRVLQSLGHPVIGPLIGVFFLTTVAFSNMEVAFPLYVNAGLGRPLQVVYGLLIYIGLLLAFMQGYVVRKLVKFIPEAVLVVAGVAAQAIGLGLLPLIPSTAWLFFPLAIISFGQGISVPSLLALVSKATTAERQGETLGITQSASSLARIVGPFMVGGVITFGQYATGSELWGLRWPFWSGGIIMLAATGMAVLTRTRLLRRPITDLAD